MASQNIEPIHFIDLKDQTNEKSPLLGALFLFFLFVFSFLFLYFLYVCIHRRASLSSTSQNQNGPPPPEGLDPATITGLPIFSYGSSFNNKTNQEADCPICLSMFLERDKVKVLPRCHHGFHSECVDKWLTTQSNCPLCRTSILQQNSLSDLEIS